MLPMNYPVEEIRKKFEELVIFPAKFMVSNFAHRSLQIIALILKDCMVTGRFAPVFFTYMRLNYDGYFRSCSSDDLGETRDGWDKYYMTRDAVICLKRCDALGIDVPSEVRQRCERMKLSYNYYWGKSEGMFGGGESGCWKYGILSENELFKDVCILDEQQDMSAFAHIKEEQSRYNTLSLMYYLAHSDEEDVSFVRLCIKHGAKLDEACEQAVREMEREAQKNFKQTRFGTILRRTAFISSLESRLL